MRSQLECLFNFTVYIFIRTRHYLAVVGVSVSPLSVFWRHEVCWKTSAKGASDVRDLSDISIASVDAVYDDKPAMSKRRVVLRSEQRHSAVRRGCIEWYRRNIFRSHEA